ILSALPLGPNRPPQLTVFKTRLPGKPGGPNTPASRYCPLCYLANPASATHGFQRV
ncbi:hypothetical protein PanWU01x14_262360, partial [Parasponia andersonii]